MNQRIKDIATATELIARHTRTPHAAILRALVGVAIHRDDVHEVLEALASGAHRYPLRVGPNPEAKNISERSKAYYRAVRITAEAKP